MKSEKNESEVLFEQYLVDQGISEWHYEPAVAGKTRRPDYRVCYRDEELIFDVKEFRQRGFNPTGPRDRYAPIREKINQAQKQFKEYKEHPCSLVLYNVDVPFLDIHAPELTLGAMLGDLGIQWDVSFDAGAPPDLASWVFGGRGKMIDYKHVKPQNTTISAVITLHQFDLAGPEFELELNRREQSGIGNLDKDEFEECLRKFLAGRSKHAPSHVLRTVVFENPYARMPLTRDLFRGDFDVRWGTEGEFIRPVFVGLELQRIDDEFNQLRDQSRPNGASGE